MEMGLSFVISDRGGITLLEVVVVGLRLASHTLSPFFFLHLPACSKNPSERAVCVAWDGIARDRKGARVSRKGHISDFASRVWGKKPSGLQQGEPQTRSSLHSPPHCCSGLQATVMSDMGYTCIRFYAQHPWIS